MPVRKFSKMTYLYSFRLKPNFRKQKHSRAAGLFLWSRESFVSNIEVSQEERLLHIRYAAIR